MLCPVVSTLGALSEGLSLSKFSRLMSLSFSSTGLLQPLYPSLISTFSECLDHIYSQASPSFPASPVSSSTSILVSSFCVPGAALPGPEERSSRDPTVSQGDDKTAKAIERRVHRRSVQLRSCSSQASSAKGFVQYKAVQD